MTTSAVGVSIKSWQVSVCNACQRRYHADEWNDAGGHPRDLADPCRCDRGFHIGKATIEDRWGDPHFTALPDALIEHADALRLGGNDLLVLLALEFIASRRTLDTTAPVLEIARRARLSESTVKRTLADLGSRGLIVATRGKRRSGYGEPNRYSTAPLRYLIKSLAQIEANKVSEVARAMVDDLEIRAYREKLRSEP